MQAEWQILTIGLAVLSGIGLARVSHYWVVARGFSQWACLEWQPLWVSLVDLASVMALGALVVAVVSAKWIERMNRASVWTAIVLCTVLAVTELAVIMPSSGILIWS